MRKLVFVPSSDDEEYLNAGFSLIDRAGTVPSKPDFFPILDGEELIARQRLSIVLHSYTVTQENIWEMFPRDKARHRKAYEITGKGVIAPDVQISVLDNRGIILRSVDVRIRSEPATLKPRSQLLMLGGRPFAGAWLPSDGFAEMLDGLRSTRVQPILNLQMDLYLPHVFCTNSAYEESEPSLLGLISDQKNIENYDEIPDEWRETHLIKRWPRESPVRVVFQEVF